MSKSFPRNETSTYRTSAMSPVANTMRTPCSSRVTADCVSVEKPRVTPTAVENTPMATTKRKKNHLGRAWARCGCSRCTTGSSEVVIVHTAAKTGSSAVTSSPASCGRPTARK